MDTNFLLPWLNKQSFLPKIPNNPLDKLKNSSSLNNPNGGFLEDTAPMSIDPRYAKKPSTPPMSIAPKISRQAPMSVMPKTTSQDFELPSFTDFQNQNFIPDPLKSFTPTYNVNKTKLEIPREQSKINEKNKVISNNYNKKRNAMYSFMADVQKNDGGMTREMIEEHYPEFADNIESALQLQAEIAPIVSKGEAVKLSEIQKYYPELLSEPKFLKKSEVKKKDNEAKEYLKKISKVDQSVLSNEGKKWLGLMQGMQELADQTRLQYQVPKDITDTEITNYLISNNPELKKRYQEGINAKLTDYDKAQLKLGGNWMNKFSATAQNLTHRANAWLSKNVIEPYMQASEEFKESNPNLSAINAPVKALLQIPGGLLHGTDKALSSMQRLANADYQSAGEIIGDGIKGLGGGGEVAFNTALAPLTAKFHTLGGTKAGKVALDNTFGLLEEGLENIFQAPGVSKLYNALDEEARVDLKNGIIIGLLHKGNKATENTRFNAKMAIKTATDAFNNAIQKGVNSGRFQIWVEKGLAHENGRFQDGALGRIVKEGVSEFQSAFKENLGKFNDVINARRQQVNTLTDKRGFVETTKSEIKEGVESVKKGAKNVGSAIKAETENLVGGIKKKINNLNTKSPVKQEGEIKVGSAGSSDKINTENSSQKFSNFNRKLLQNQNRIDPSKIVEFEKKTNQKYGDYMLERGRVGGPEENIAKMTKHINDLKEQKKQAFEKMSGTAQSEAVGTLLTDIVERATQVRDPQTVKFTTMLTKHNEGGISFSELEEAKRRYEKNIKTGYYKDNNSVGIQRATNLDTEIREYQQKEAIKQGFQNIKELNKEISNTYFLSNEILRKQLKMDANNQVSLTDYLLLGAMPDNATGFAGLALKIAMKNKSIKNNMLHVVAKMFGNHKNSKEIKTDLDRIEKIADQKAVADAIERFMKKWDIKETPALPRFPEATIVGKNGPQVKNPLSPQPTKRSVIEIDKRFKDTNKSDKGNIVGLKKTVKSGKKENSEYNEAKKVGVVQPFVSLSSESESTRTTNFTKSNNTPSVSLTEKRDKVVGLKVGSSGATSRGGDSGRPTTDFSKLEKTKSVGGNFDISKIDKEYSSNYDKIVNGEGDNLAVGKIDGKVAYDGKERHAIFSQFIKDKIDADHGLDKGNLLATINEPDYIIKNVDGKIDKINIIKGIEGSNDFVLVGADRQNGYFILSNYEIKSRNNKRLAKSLGRGEIVIDNIGDGKTLAKSEKQNIIGIVKPLTSKPKQDGGKQQIVGGIKQRVGQANGRGEAWNRSLMEQDQKVIQTGNPGGGDEILRGSTDNSQSLGDGSQTSSKTRGQLREVNTKVKEILNDHNFSIDRNSYSQEELETLAQYEGAGGLTNKGEDTTGVLDQFYTPDSVIQAMWRMVKPFKQDSILEPSVGVGRFLKYAPKKSKITAFDIDKTAGTIAQLLYPNAKVNIGEKLGDFQNQFMDFAGNPTFYRGERYDLVIGNPPYKERNTPQRVKGEEKKINRFEEYFIKKGVSVLNDGGHLIMIVPSSFLDKGSTAVKEWLNTHAELIDAYRLPEGTFDNTQVGTDIVLFEKKVPREQLLENGAYFEKYPEKILGAIETRVNRFGEEEQFIKGDRLAVEKIGERETIQLENNEPQNIVGIKPKKTKTIQPEKKKAVVGIKKGVIKKRVIVGDKSDIADYTSEEGAIANFQNLTDADGFVDARVGDNPDLLNSIKEKIVSYGEQADLGNPTKAPAGAKTAKYQLAEPIKSENFKKWFGDWESDPKNASKVVNEKGEPLLMYHGSPEKFTIFDSDFMSQHGSSKGYGFYFSPDKKMAEGYGDAMSVYLDIKNPLSKDKLSISRKEMKNLILDVENNIAKRWGTDDGTLLDNFGDIKRYGKDRVLADAIDMLMENESDVDVFGELKNIGGDYDSVAKSFRKILGKDGIITPKEYIVFESNQIKSATDNIGTYDLNNPDIRYQKHGVANPLEKEISAEKAIQLRNIRNGRSVQELADHYGLDTKIVEKITTPEGLQAYGKYGDGIITLAEKIKEGTAPHELFHATFDIVDHARKETILEGVMKEKKVDKVQAEEYLADSFSEYFRTGRMKGEKVIGNVGKPLGKKLYDAVKDFFKQVKDWITGVSKTKKQVKQLFDEILDGEVDRGMIKDFFNQKNTSPLFHAKGVGEVYKRSVKISPENANIIAQNLSELKNNTDGLTYKNFVPKLQEALTTKGDSTYITNKIDGVKYTLRVSNHNANAYHSLGHPKNNTSVVVKILELDFKHNKNVDLVEFVYDKNELTPQKMSGIVNGVQDWMDTGKYTDKGYNEVNTSIRATLENGEVKYQIAYHGSPYEFKQFDSTQMEKRPGAHAHGWGHYVAVDDTTARSYATNQNGKIAYKGKEINKFLDSSEGSRKSEAEKEVLKDIANNMSEYFDRPEDARDRAQMEYERNINSGIEVEHNREKLKILRQEDHNNFVEQGGNLYEVDIPDDNGANYLKETGTLSTEQKKIIRKGVVDLLMNERGFEKLDAQSMIKDIFKNAKTGGQIYSYLVYYLSLSKKEASLFLDKLGFDGISYHDGGAGDAYVIFNDNKLEIKKHEKL